MTDTLALEKLYNDVVTQFAYDAAAQSILPVPNLFGWRERAKHVVTGASSTPAGNVSQPNNRIVWIPGNEPGDGDIGKHAAAKYPGDNPRSLATLLETFTVYVQGYDSTAPANELAQYKAARLLYDAWFRAAYIAAYGTFSVESVKWDRTKTERQNGAMIIAVCTVQAKIPDSALTLAPVDTHAELVTAVLDQTDPEVEVDPVP